MWHNLSETNLLRKAHLSVELRIVIWSVHVPDIFLEINIAVLVLVNIFHSFLK